MRSVSSSPRFYVSSAVDSRTSGFHLSLRDPLAGWGGAPPPAVDPSSRAGYLSCPNDNAVHDRSGHPGGYHNPGWKNAERSGGGRRCLHRLRGQPLDNTVIAIDTRTGAQTVISAEGEPTPSPSTPPGTPLSPATPQPEPHRSSNGAGDAAHCEAGSARLEVKPRLPADRSPIRGGSAPANRSGCLVALKGAPEGSRTLTF